MIIYVHRTGEIGFAPTISDVPFTCMRLTGPVAESRAMEAVRQTATFLEETWAYIVPEMVEAGSNNDAARHAADEYAVTLCDRLYTLRRKYAPTKIVARRRAVTA